MLRKQHKRVFIPTHTHIKENLVHITLKLYNKNIRIYLYIKVCITDESKLVCIKKKFNDDNDDLMMT